MKKELNSEGLAQAGQQIAMKVGRRALIKQLTFAAAQPHEIFLYDNFLRSHDHQTLSN